MCLEKNNRLLRKQSEKSAIRIMEVSTAGSSNSYASVLNPSENSPKQKEIPITNDNNNKENIPGKILTDKKNEQRTTDRPKDNETPAVDSKPNEELDESGFVPVVSHAKKDKKMRQMERRGGDQRDGGSKPPKSATSKSQERPEKPKRNRRERKPPKDKTTAPTQTNHHDSSDPDKAADSSDGQNDKKIKFVEAPLPQVNPWVSPTAGVRHRNRRQSNPTLLSSLPSFVSPFDDKKKVKTQALTSSPSDADKKSNEKPKPVKVQTQGKYRY